MLSHVYLNKCAVSFDLFARTFGSNNNYGEMVDWLPSKPITMNIGMGDRVSVYRPFYYP